MSTLGGIGLVLNTITAGLIVYLYRNYEFQEMNRIKRKFSQLLFLQIVLRFLLVISSFIGMSQTVTLSHIAAHLLGISTIYCCFANWPFSYKQISRYYTFWCFVFEWIMIASSVWIFSETLSQENLFYMIFIVSSLIGAGGTALWNKRYNEIMKLNESTSPSLYYFYDFYCEEIVSKTLESSNDNLAKFAVMEFLNYHRTVCPGRFEKIKPPCQTVQYLDSRRLIIEQRVFMVLDNIFQRKLGQQRVLKDQDVFERLSLKYISFLAKFCNNPYRAYSQLKRLISLNEAKMSTYFAKICKILSQNIEQHIIQIYMNAELSETQIGSAGQGLSGGQSMQSQQLSLKSLFAVENLKITFVPQFIEFSKNKIYVLENLMKGNYKSIEQFKDTGILLAQRGLKIRREFQLALQGLSQEKNNATLFKLRAIYYALLMNEVIATKQFEDSCLELRRRDLSKPSDLLHNISIIKNNIANFTISLIKDPQKIVSKLTPQQARFFRYQQRDFEDHVTSITQLMPAFIAPYHHTFLDGFIQRGYSNIVLQSHRTFAVDGRGFIFPIAIQISHVFTAEDDFQINGAMLRIEMNDGMILFDEHGLILGLNHPAYTLLFRKHSRQLALIHTYHTSANINVSQNYKSNTSIHESQSIAGASGGQGGVSGGVNVGAGLGKNTPNPHSSPQQQQISQASQQAASAALSLRQIKSKSFDKSRCNSNQSKNSIKSQSQRFVQHQQQYNCQITVPELQYIAGQFQQNNQLFLIFPKLVKVLQELQQNERIRSIFENILAQDHEEDVHIDEIDGEAQQEISGAGDHIINNLGNRASAVLSGTGGGGGGGIGVSGAGAAVSSGGDAPGGFNNSSGGLNDKSGRFPNNINNQNSNINNPHIRQRSKQGTTKAGLKQKNDVMKIVSTQLLAPNQVGRFKLPKNIVSLSQAFNIEINNCNHQSAFVGLEQNIAQQLEPISRSISKHQQDLDLSSSSKQDASSVLNINYLQRLLDFIDENKEFWSTQQCICDYFIQFDLFCNVIYIEGQPRIFFSCQIKSVEECQDKQDVMSLALGQHQRSSDWSSSKGNMSSSFSNIQSMQESALNLQMGQGGGGGQPKTQDIGKLKQPPPPDPNPESQQQKQQPPLNNIHKKGRQHTMNEEEKQVSEKQDELISPFLRKQLQRNMTDNKTSAGDVTPITNSGTSKLQTTNQTPSVNFSSSHQNISQSLIPDFPKISKSQQKQYAKQQQSKSATVNTNTNANNQQQQQLKQNPQQLTPEQQLQLQPFDRDQEPLNEEQLALQLNQSTIFSPQMPGGGQGSEQQTGYQHINRVRQKDLSWFLNNSLQQYQKDSNLERQSEIDQDLELRQLELELSNEQKQQQKRTGSNQKILDSSSSNKVQQGVNSSSRIYQQYSQEIIDEQNEDLEDKFSSYNLDNKRSKNKLAGTGLGTDINGGEGLGDAYYNATNKNNNNNNNNEQLLPGFGGAGSYQPELEQTPIMMNVSQQMPLSPLNNSVQSQMPLQQQQQQQQQQEAQDDAPIPKPNSRLKFMESEDNHIITNRKYLVNGEVEKDERRLGLGSQQSLKQPGEQENTTRSLIKHEQDQQQHNNHHHHNQATHSPTKIAKESVSYYTKDDNYNSSKFMYNPTFNSRDTSIAAVVGHQKFFNHDQKKIQEHLERNKQSSKDQNIEPNQFNKQKKHEKQPFDDDAVAMLLLNQRESQASSQISFSSNTDNEILRKMANSTIMPTPLRDFRLMMTLFLLTFLGLMLYFLFTKVSQLEELFGQNAESDLPSQLSSAYGQGMQSTFFMIQNRQDFPLPNLYSQEIVDNRLEEMIQFLNESITDYSALIAEHNDIIIKWSESGKNYAGFGDDQQKYNTILIKNSVQFNQSFWMHQLCFFIIERFRSIRDDFYELVTNSTNDTTMIQTGSAAIDLNTFYTLILNSNMYITLLDAILEDQNNIIDDIQQNFVYSNIGFICVALAIFAVIMGSTMPVLLRINVYQEKVLLLVSRMNEKECSTQITRLQSCVNALVHPHEKWMYVNCIDMFFFDNESKRNPQAEPSNYYQNSQEYDSHYTRKRQQSQFKHGGGEQGGIADPVAGTGAGVGIGTHLQRSRELSKPGMVGAGQNNSQNINQKRNMALSSKIQNHKLSIKALIAFFIISCLFATLFFAIIVIVVQNMSSDVQPSIDLNQHCFTANIKINQIIVMADLLAMDYINRVATGSTQSNTMSPKHLSWPVLNLPTLRKTLQSAIDYVEQFKTDFSVILKKCKLFSSEKIAMLNNIFFSDICTIMHCDQTSQGQFKEGLIGIITSYKKLIISFQDIFFEDVNENSTDFLIRYFRSSEHTVLITDGYDIPKTSLIRMTEIAIDAILQAIETVKGVVYIYIIILGIIILGIFFIAILFIERNLQNQIQSINFFLTMIPIEKWNEEITVHMLRQISSI